MTKRKFSFVQLDVFTRRPLEGNQLAVFTDARGLSDEEMQKLARETNLCETTFILPRDASRRARSKGTRSASSPSMKSCPSRDIPRWAQPGTCANSQPWTKLCST